MSGPPGVAVAAPALETSRALRLSTWLAIAAHATLTCWLAFARFGSFHNHTFDLALYGRMAWGVVHGQAWDPIVGGGFWGAHLPLVLLPLGALGRLFGIVPVLLVAQSMALALAAWPIACVATRRLGPSAGLAAALVFLLYPNLGHVASYEMHPGNLAILPLCCAFDALDRRRPWALIAYAALAVVCRASLALQTLLLGLLAVFAPFRLRRSGLILALGSAAYFALVQSLPGSQPGQALARTLDLHFGIWGGTPLGVLPALLRDPGRVIAHFASARRLSYPLRVLLPFGLLPLLRPRWLLCALPPLALNLLSQFPTAPELYSHYLTPALPPLAFGAVEGLRVLYDRVPNARRAAPWLLAALGASCNVFSGGLPWSRDFAAGDFRADSATASAQRLLGYIDAAASVQAPDPLLAHLCERRLVFRAPPPERGAQFVALDVSHRLRFAGREDLLRTFEEPIARRWLARPDYGVVYADARYLLLRRGSAPRAGVALRFLIGHSATAEGVALTGCLLLRDAALDARLTLEFVARGPCPADLALRLGSQAAPYRVDLPFEGAFSPAQLRAGDIVRSAHDVSLEERRALLSGRLRVGALRASGAPADPHDPISVAFAVHPTAHAAPAAPSP